MKSYRIPIKVVLYREDDRWIAHCLEFDLCGDGDTIDDSLQSLTAAIVIQIEHSLQENNPKNLFRPADGKFFQMFAAGKDCLVGSFELGEIKIEVDGFEVSSIDAREYVDQVDDKDSVYA